MTLTTDAPLRATTHPAPPLSGGNLLGRLASAMAPSRAGCGPRCSRCSPPPRCCTCGAWAPRAGPTSYYAAAAQAGTQDWKAWLFGSLDAGNAITVDKPPAALWVMALSGRLVRVQPVHHAAAAGIDGRGGSRACLYAAVRRVSGPGAGLIAGAVLALTPVAALMFRYNNPDALLVLLLVVAAYCMVRAIETGRHALGRARRGGRSGSPS